MAESRSAADVVKAAKDAAALIVQWAPITNAVLGELSQLKFISRLGIGYDMIDVDAATNQGIAVANTPVYCIDEVATHTIALILSLTRGLNRYDRAVRDGIWRATAGAPKVVRPSATTVLVVGFGRIGAIVARGVLALGYRVLVHDPYVDAARLAANGFRPVALAEGLAESDVVSLHVPLSESTRHLLDRDSFAKIKSGAVIINTCRGGLIDESALVESLAAGRISGAGLDVFEDEPLPVDHPLLAFDTVLVTPHAAWYSPESLVDLPVHAAANVIDFLQGRDVEAIVNRSYPTGGHAAAPV
jgi:D-3-phosphoglycerate dehydrogenase